MVTRVPISTSVLALTTVIPTPTARTRSDRTLVLATTDTLATESVVWQIQLRRRHRMSMSVLSTPTIVMATQRARTLRDRSHARVTAVTKEMVQAVLISMSVLAELTPVMATLRAPTPPEDTRALATAALLAMDSAARISMSAPTTRMTVTPTLHAPTPTEGSRALVTADTRAMV